jgi:acyl-coenzyme A synthetase/AMP-(fatty) acid ligase
MTFADIISQRASSADSQQNIILLSSGQRIKEDLFRRFDQSVGACLINQYGSSEMGAIAACTPDNPIELRVAMLGKPMDGVSLKVEEVQPDAELEVIGRADNSINRSGYLVLLTDIEKTLEKLPTVKQVVVVTMEKENMQGQQLAAFCMILPIF